MHQHIRIPEDTKDIHPAALSFRVNTNIKEDKLMPKSKLAEIVKENGVRKHDDYIANIAINISYEMYVQHMTFREMSKKTGIAESTIRLRMNKPGSFKQIEIAEIAKALKISPFKLVSQKLEYRGD